VSRSEKLRLEGYHLSPVLYQEVVARRGWPKERWRKWIAETLAGAILGQA